MSGSGSVTAKLFMSSQGFPCATRRHDAMLAKWSQSAVTSAARPPCAKAADQSHAANAEPVSCTDTSASYAASAASSCTNTPGVPVVPELVHTT